jgi:hypothetical protein
VVEDDALQRVALSEFLSDRDVDVVHAVLEEEIQRPVRLALRNVTECSRTEDRARALVAGPAERRAGVDPLVAVDPDHPGPDSGRDEVGPGEVAGRWHVASGPQSAATGLPGGCLSWRQTDAGSTLPAFGDSGGPHLGAYVTPGTGCVLRRCWLRC